MSANEGMELFHSFLDKFDLPATMGLTRTVFPSPHRATKVLKVVLSGLAVMNFSVVIHHSK